MNELTFKEEFIKATKVLVALTFVCYAIEFLFTNSCTWNDIKEWTITNAFFTYPFYFSNGYLNAYLNQKLPWRANPRKRGMIGTPITIILNLVVIYVVGTLVTVYVYGGPANYLFTTQGKNTVLVSLVIVTVITLLFYSVGFFQEVQKERLLNESLRKEKVEAELNALKAQVDPHFLFNSFNVLSGLIDEDPSKAQKFLSGLSKIYRYVLENRDEGLVTVHDELTFAKQYLDLQKVRFEDSIHLDLDVPDEYLVKKLPSLSLQLLLENAITHNGFDSKAPLHISIQADKQAITVSNNKQDRIKLTEGSGMGLKNISQRYDLHKVEGFSIYDSTENFIVHLPLIS